jgi:hypothetical protein
MMFLLGLLGLTGFAPTLWRQKRKVLNIVLPGHFDQAFHVASDSYDTTILVLEVHFVLRALAAGAVHLRQNAGWLPGLGRLGHMQTPLIEKVNRVLFANLDAL